MIIQGDCHDVLATFGTQSVDMVLFSPPYDNLRTYDGLARVDLPLLGHILMRVLKPNSVCAMVIQDATINGVKSGTSFRTVVEWMDNGWKLWETIIYSRPGVPGEYTNRRPRVDHEYIFLMTNGTPTYDGSSLRLVSPSAGRRTGADPRRQRDGTMHRSKPKILGEEKNVGTIWHHGTAGGHHGLKSDHPATFPDKLAADLIQAFTTHGQTVLDPMCGSGTTVLMAEQTGRKGVGIEINPFYVSIANNRLEAYARQPYFAGLDE